jgi:hypothetical protein
MREKIKQVNDLCAANGAYLNQHNKENSISLVKD